MKAKRFFYGLVQVVVEVVLVPAMSAGALMARYAKKEIDIGLGPEPLINNIYHKLALEKAGYTCETFVDTTWHISDRFDRSFEARTKLASYVSLLVCPAYWHAISNYKGLYIYFNGGPLMRTRLLWRLEPFLLRLAGLKVVVMPYGGDVQALDLCKNLYFKASMIKDYPEVFRLNKKVHNKIRMWSESGAYIISGCDWVDYMYQWNRLMISHFSYDTGGSNGLPARQEGNHDKKFSRDRPMRVLHAPNHRNIKGTSHILKAIDELKASGLEIELVLIEKQPNAKVIEEIRKCDLVIDQIVIGWYAMFSIEAMAQCKPVICYLRDDLKDLFIMSGYLGVDEIPIVSATPLNISEVIRGLYQSPGEMQALGSRGREYVERHHSLEYIGGVFKEINTEIGISTNKQR